jgi:hypothetical protein
MSWSWSDKTDAGARRAKLASEGFIELMRAAHVAPRGIAKIAAAALDSYAGTSKEIDIAIAKKDELLKLVSDFTGDGKFKAAVTGTGKVVSVRLSGKKLSDVLPIGFLAPAIGLGLYVQAQEKTEIAPIGVKPAPGKPAAKPAPLKPAPAPKKPAPAQKR